MDFKLIMKIISHYYTTLNKRIQQIWKKFKRASKQMKLSPIMGNVETTPFIACKSDVCLIVGALKCETTL